MVMIISDQVSGASVILKGSAKSSEAPLCSVSVDSGLCLGSDISLNICVIWMTDS